MSENILKRNLGFFLSPYRRKAKINYLGGSTTAVVGTLGRRGRPLLTGFEM